MSKQCSKKEHCLPDEICAETTIYAGPCHSFFSRICIPKDFEKIPGEHSIDEFYEGTL